MLLLQAWPTWKFRMSPERMLGTGTGIFGQRSQPQGGMGGMSVQGQELDLMILAGPDWDIL